MNGTNLNNLRYADDTAILAREQNDLQEIVNKINEENSKAGLDMNVKKTKPMIILRKAEV